MDDDATDAAWHQLEQEERQYREFLARDPGYLEWLASIENLRTGDEHEISSESIH